MAPLPCCILSCERVSSEFYHYVSFPISLLFESWLHLQTTLSFRGWVKGKALLNSCQAAKSPQRQRENFSVFGLDKLMQHNLSAGLQSFFQQSEQSGAQARVRLIASSAGSCLGCCLTCVCLWTSFQPCYTYVCMSGSYWCDWDGRGRIKLFENLSNFSHIRDFWQHWGLIIHQFPMN